MSEFGPQSSVAVIGSGTMGSGIAQVVAAAGIPVTLVDKTEVDLDRGRSLIEKSLDRMVANGSIDQAAAEQTLARIEAATSFDSIAEASAVIEAVFEDTRVKRQVIQEIDAAAPDANFVATNTSSISVTSIAGYSSRPERVAGMHFFNPVPVLLLVEIVRAAQTSEATIARAIALAERIGKQPMVVNDAPGFVANRILIPMINEAIFMLEQNVAAKEDIDSIMKLGAGHPLGPLALADLIGLDICLAIMEVLHRDLGEDKYCPAPLLRRMVSAGYLGRKSGRGFYVYT